ncbi:MAG: hypothetical protein KDD41_11990 [Flavobacteriales bacterium]|nr:hypothetical protein [Flavobacteriales bacterium]
MLLLIGSYGFGQDTLEIKKSTVLKRPQPWVCATKDDVTISDDEIEQTEAIESIRISVEQINNDSSYTTKTLNSEEFQTEVYDGGGELRGYFKDGELVKMIEWTGLSSCAYLTEYYLKEGQLIFAYTQGKEFQYVDSIASFNYDIQTLVMEGRFYYKNGKKVKDIVKGATRCSGQLGKDWFKSYQDDAKYYSKLLK